MRYRFREFTLSPQRRQLVRDGREVPLIPKYFDLLLLLVERRHEAVHRREIFDHVWSDVIVSDSALSQAIRTIRRTLGDDSRDPQFIRTVSRHGYQFVLDVIEEEEDSRDAQPSPAPAAPASPPPLPRAPLWRGGSTGGALAGVFAGGVGGLMLTLAPGSSAPIAIAPVLAVIGGGCGAIGGAGVGAGMSFTGSRTALPPLLATIIGAALGGGLAGLTVQWLARWSLAAVLGLDVAVGGGVAGLAIGAAAGAGLAMTEGLERLRSALTTAVLCGLAGLLLAIAGYPLVGGTIHAIADAASGSPATLAPLGRLIGEPDFGPVSRRILAFGEGATFGLGLAYGLLRPGFLSHHRNLT